MNIQGLVDLVRTYIGFPTPQTGGDDRLDNLDIIRWINDGFDKMVGEVGGLEAYTEFTITDAGVIVVTEPAAGENPPTIALNNPPLSDYGLFKISDALSYVKFRNKTTELEDDSRRILVRRSINNPHRQEIYNNAQDYYDSYDLVGTSGFCLMPFTVNETNTIGVGYKKKFRRLNFSTPEFHGLGTLNDITLGGVYTGTSDIQLRIQMDGGTNPQTYKWSIDNGTTWVASGVSMSTTATALGNYGITVKWGAVTGHNLHDFWNSDVNVEPLTDFTEDEQSGFPVHYACWQVSKQIRDMDGLVFMQDAMRYMNEWIEGRFYADRTMDFSLDNPVRGTIRDTIL